MIKILETILGIVVPIIISVIVGYKLTASKILRCIFVPSLSLVDVSKEVLDKIKVTYNGKPVENLSSIVVKIRNSSYSGLVDAQFVNPLKIKFDDDIKLLEYEILERSNSDRETKILMKDNVATLEKITLLNKFDFIIVRFIHEGISKSKIPKVKGDVKDYDIKKVVGVIKGKQEANFMLLDGIFLTFIGFCLFPLSIILFYYRLTIFAGTNSIVDYLIPAMFLIIASIAILIFITGIKKLYSYLTCVIEIKPKGEIKNE